MKVLQKIKRYFTNQNETLSLSAINELFFSGSSAQYGADIPEITYFTCLKTLSEALGKMPVYLMGENKERVTKHETARFLSISPNAV